MSTSVDQVLRDNYGRVAKDLIAPMLDLVTEAHRTFGGDIEKFHIILLIGLRTVEHRDAAAIDFKAIEAGQLTELPSLATNVKSIAASTGIPEETARRKVRALVREGWIARTGNVLTYTAKAAHDLTCMRRALIRVATQNHRTVERLLKACETA
ncbi:MAG: hypothetical protein E7812_07760 [Phenylobacterium sp.]|nr:MAG: hypothetical protein E7812_07760 [Phenylobacterium sp.]